jgi:hypothetical protein
LFSQAIVARSACNLVHDAHYGNNQTFTMTVAAPDAIGQVHVMFSVLMVSMAEHRKPSETMP